MVEAQRILHSAWVYRLELKKSIGQHGGSAMCRKPREKTRERIREKTQRENPKGKPRGKTQRENQRENPERKPREKTQRENPERKPREKVDPQPPSSVFRDAPARLHPPKERKQEAGCKTPSTDFPKKCKKKREMQKMP